MLPREGRTTLESVVRRAGEGEVMAASVRLSAGEEGSVGSTAGQRLNAGR